MRFGRLVIWIAVVILLSSCEERQEENSVAAKFFEDAKMLPQVGELGLAEMVTSDWTRVCFHGGYQTIPELNIKNDETDWTLVFYRGEVEISRIQGAYRKLILNSPRTTLPDCHGRNAALGWEDGRAIFRAAIH